MKLTIKKIKKLIKEELQNSLHEEEMNAHMSAMIDKNMQAISPEEYKKALKDPKTKAAVQKIAAKLGLNKVQEDATKMKETVKKAAMLAAGSGSLFGLNAAFIAGAGLTGQMLVTMGGIGALVGLIAYALGPASVDLPDAIRDLKK